MLMLIIAVGIFRTTVSACVLLLLADNILKYSCLWKRPPPIPSHTKSSTCQLCFVKRHKWKSYRVDHVLYMKPDSCGFNTLFSGHTLSVVLIFFTQNVTFESRCTSFCLPVLPHYCPRVMPQHCVNVTSGVSAGVKHQWCN